LTNTTSSGSSYRICEEIDYHLLQKHLKSKSQQFIDFCAESRVESFSKIS